ncbi:MAG TPA: nuclear transport factor 2 family protein [Solirubrobacteraceae bacterium]|jgi:ketosteroid isomerase-like protein|nr:nuclear transport factor 2 family protein [Solirubrobacteraceae bacterium]
MAGDHVESACEGYAAFGRGDWQWMIAHSTADVVVVQPPERPSAKTYRGRTEFRAAFTEWPGQWDAFELELVDVVAVNDHQVLGTCRQRMRAGDLELEQDRFDVFTFREGRMARLELFHSLDQARAVIDSA